MAKSKSSMPPKGMMKKNMMGGKHPMPPDGHMMSDKEMEKVMGKKKGKK